MFRFTIRELVLLTLVVAMGVGWWLDRSRLDGKCSALQSRINILTRYPSEPTLFWQQVP